MKNFLGSALARLTRAPQNGLGTSVHEAADAAGEDDDVENTTRNYLLFVLLPVWVIPGFLDYFFHRRTDIEHTSGTHESLLHSAQMTTIGLPTLAALLFEINSGVIAAMSAAFVAHETLTIWDIAYAANRRDVSPNEQHCHSFLEALPFMALSYVYCLHPGETLALLGLGDETPSFRLERKRKPLPSAYVAAILALISLLIGVPYADELVRCLRVDPQPLPRPEPL